MIDAVNSRARTPITGPYIASLLISVSLARKAVRNTFPFKN